MTQVMAAPTPLRHPGAVARNAQGPDRRSGAPLAQRAPAAPRERLLATRVSRVIEAHPDALGVLIDGGFTPLANPAMRLALAPTVTLGQALRIRGLEDAAADALIDRLLTLTAPTEEG